MLSSCRSPADRCDAQQFAKCRASTRLSILLQEPSKADVEKLKEQLGVKALQWNELRVFLAAAAGEDFFQVWQVLVSSGLLCV
jgi:hypothetical protein